jgi:hypothetical protein
MSFFDLHICSDFHQKMRHVQKASYNYDSIFEHATLQCNLEPSNSPAIT